MVEREISFGRFRLDLTRREVRRGINSLRLDCRVRDWVRIAEDRAWLRAVYSRRAEVRALSEGPHWIEPPSEGGKVRNWRFFLLAAAHGEGLCTEPIAGAQPWRPEPSLVPHS
jgi:hypothetical protein